MSSLRPLTPDELKLHPLPRFEDAGKDRHGRLLVVAGSEQTPGSAVIAATAALRSGSGKVSIATVEPMAPHVAMAVPEALLIALPMGRDGGISNPAVGQLIGLLPEHDAVVAGPGMKQGEACSQLARRLLDAGLNRLALDAAILYELHPHRSAQAPILLPHDREMAALIGCDVEEARREPLRCGRLCAEWFGALVLVKGPQSHIVTPDGSAWKYEGDIPGLGIAGSGDALAGILGGLLARGAEPVSALLWAVWLHGEAGRVLSKRSGPIGFLAREISGEVPALLAKTHPSFE